MALREQLDQIRAGAEERIPAAALELMHRATQELHDSGAEQDIIQPGERLPEFDLPNQYGDRVNSRALLAHGPLILTVYRGFW